MYEYIASLHVHSQYSDGSGSISHIADCAKNAGVDIVVINDHHTLESLNKGEEGYYGKVLMLIGSEINKKNNHYLAMNITEEVEDSTDDPQKVIDQVNRQGGLGFIAHPFEKGSPLLFEGRAYKWNDWNVEKYTGICVWNYCSQWRDGATSIFKLLYSVFIDRNMAIYGPCSKAMEKIDQISQDRHIVLIGGTDAHAVKIGRWPFSMEIFPYEYLFKTINTHILMEVPLTNKLKDDKVNFYKALKRGSCFISFDYYHSAKGFRMTVDDVKKPLGTMGSTVNYKERLRIQAKFPMECYGRIFCNGKLIQEYFGEQIESEISAPGAYRVEAYIKIKGKMCPWIFSNPIFVR